jgi:nucleoside-diphosphate-sugar epimerase
MRIAILGATSQIARDLVLSLVQAGGQNELQLFARRPGAVSAWLDAVGLTGRFPVASFGAFGDGDYDAIVNFVGVGDPARAAAMGAAIFDATLEFDQLALRYVSARRDCRYLFLSSGAAYGGGFEAPARRSSKAVVSINDLSPQEWYGAAKVHAECRHRSLPELPIIDVRVFNYFSRTQDLSARFLLTDIVRSIRDAVVLRTTPDYLVRDYLHPADFLGLVRSLLASPAANAAVDCYTRAPVDKPALLAAMEQQFGLRYEIVGEPVAINATGIKPYYYSLNDRAADFGYAPTRTAIEGVMEEAGALLGGHDRRGAAPP